MQTYVFRVVVEPDEDRWMAYCPALDQYAAETWGYIKEEARKNIEEVIRMVLEEMAEEGQPIPGESGEAMISSPEQRVAISI